MTFTRIHTEGDLIPTDTLEEIAAGESAGQQVSDFRPSRTTRLTVMEKPTRPGRRVGLACLGARSAAFGEARMNATIQPSLCTLRTSVV